MGTTVKRPVQTEMPEVRAVDRFARPSIAPRTAALPSPCRPLQVRNALEHLKAPAVQQAREKHLDAVSQAQVRPCTALRCRQGRPLLTELQTHRRGAAGWTAILWPTRAQAVTAQCTITYRPQALR